MDRQCCFVVKEKSNASSKVLSICEVYISSAIASVCGQGQGCLACALKSAVVSNGQRQIIFGALAMDSDIPKVRMFHVTVSRSFFFICLHGRGTHGDGKSCKQVLSWKSMKAWVVSGTSLSLEAVWVHLSTLENKRRLLKAGVDS